MKYDVVTRIDDSESDGWTSAEVNVDHVEVRDSDTGMLVWASEHSPLDEQSIEELEAELLEEWIRGLLDNTADFAGREEYKQACLDILRHMAELKSKKKGG